MRQKLGWAGEYILHGSVVKDAYWWLEMLDSVQAQEWLTRQDTLFAGHRTRWPLLDAMRARITRALDWEMWSPPIARKGRVFVAHRSKRGEHPRLLTLEAGATRVLVDVQRLDEDGTTTLDRWEPSPTGRLVAVQTSRFGTERGCLIVIDAASGECLDGPIGDVRYSPVSWVEDAAFYYVRAGQVWLHQVGSPLGTDRQVFTATPTAVVLPEVRLHHGRWLVVEHSHGSGQRRDLWLADIAAETPDTPTFREIHAGPDIDTEVVVGRQGKLYLRTTLGASRRRLCVADPVRPGIAHWRALVEERADAVLERVALAGPQLVACWSRDGLSELTAHDPTTGAMLRPITLPGAGRVIKTSMETDGSRLHWSYSEVSRPPTVLTYDSTTSQVRVGIGGSSWRRARVRRYRSRVTARDGVDIPVTVLSLAPLGTEPRATILHAYGAYGRSRDFGYSATVLAWLQFGGQYAVAHVRGGGENGAGWHRAGTRAGKRRAVTDLIAVGEWLQESGYTTPEQTCLSGGSAGGMLVLAAAVQRPELWTAVIAVAPLADMIGYERFGLGRLWTHEFGTAANPQDFATLLELSPYHQAQLRSARYPAVLLCGFDGDTRTGPEHARKMCAALQRSNTGDRPVLLRYERSVGHSTRTTSREIELAAEAHAFAASWTGLTDPGPNTVSERR